MKNKEFLKCNQLAVGTEEKHVNDLSKLIDSYEENIVREQQPADRAVRTFVRGPVQV